MVVTAESPFINIDVALRAAIIKLGASSRWSFGLNSACGTIGTTTIEYARPTLLNQTNKNINWNTPYPKFNDIKILTELFKSYDYLMVAFQHHYGACFDIFYLRQVQLEINISN